MKSIFSMGAARVTWPRCYMWAALILVSMPLAVAKGAEPLASWNDGPALQAIKYFVDRTTTAGSADFLPEIERIAVFDNDGTLWCEYPIYTQFVFAIDRVKARADKHPQWKEQQPFKAAIEDDMKGLLASGEKGLVTLIMASHAGMSTEDFEKIVSDWIATAQHPRFHRKYTELVYQPMLELLTYLRSKGYKTYIVSGGGVEFMRPWTQTVYGVPPEQVIGSSVKTKYEEINGMPVLMRLPEINFVDDKAGKPVGIYERMGRRPVMAHGNSDGDYEMLRYVTAGSGPRFGLIVHHTDAKREYAYDRDSAVGRLDRALTESARRGWVVVDMMRDWKRVFPFEEP